MFPEQSALCEARHFDKKLLAILQVLGWGVTERGQRWW